MHAHTSKSTAPFGWNPARNVITGHLTLSVIHLDFIAVNSAESSNTERDHIMTIRIRRMTVADLPEVDRIDGTAFTELITRLRNKPVSIPTHERTYFEFWMRSDPAGSLVAEEKGRVVGFSFCHAGQRMGWIGPVAVKLGQQGKGIGGKLMQAGLKYFDRTGTKTVGLDTFPENPVSVTLYLKSGFRVVGGLFMLTMQIPATKGRCKAVRIDRDDVRRVAALNRKASGFDRRHDYEFVINSGLGCGLKLQGKGDDFAFALIRRGSALISNFHITGRGDVNSKVSHLVHGTFDFFRSKGLKTAAVLCRGNDVELLGALFRLGFQMTPTMITMHRGAEARVPPLTSPFAIEKG